MASYGFEIELHNVCIGLCPLRLSFTKPYYDDTSIIKSQRDPFYDPFIKGLPVRTRADFVINFKDIYSHISKYIKEENIKDSTYLMHPLRLYTLLTQWKEDQILYLIAEQFVRSFAPFTSQIKDLLENDISCGLYGSRVRLSHQMILELIELSDFDTREIINNFELSFDHAMGPYGSIIAIPEFVVSPIGIGPLTVDPASSQKFLSNIRQFKSQLIETVKGGCYGPHEIAIQYPPFTRLMQYYFKNEICWLHASICIFPLSMLTPKISAEPFQSVQLTCAIDLTHFGVYGSPKSVGYLEHLLQYDSSFELIALDRSVFVIMREILNHAINAAKIPPTVASPWIYGAFGLVIHSCLTIWGGPDAPSSTTKNFWILYPKTSIIEILNLVFKFDSNFYCYFTEIICDFLPSEGHHWDSIRSLAETTQQNLGQYLQIIFDNINATTSKGFFRSSERINRILSENQISSLNSDEILTNNFKLFVMAVLAVPIENKKPGFDVSQTTRFFAKFDEVIKKLHPEKDIVRIKQDLLKIVKKCFGKSAIKSGAQPGRGRPKFELRQFAFNELPDADQLVHLNTVLDKVSRPCEFVPGVKALDAYQEIDTKKRLDVEEWLWFPSE